MKATGIEKLNRLANRLRKLPLFIEENIVTIVKIETEKLEQIARENIEGGERADGKYISNRGYSEAYAQYKKQFGTYKNTDYVDLKFTGSFLSSLTLEYKGKLVWRFTATDPKTPDLLKRYGGEKLLGLQQKQLEDFYKNIMLPGLLEQVALYLKADI